jgi:uncharacterized phage protein (TIGR02218 family)
VIAELYKFAIGNERWTYTNAQSPIVYQFEQYEPIYVTRDRIHGTEQLARVAIKIRLPRDAGLAARFQPRPPSRVCQLTVFQQTPAGTAAIYVGRVLGVQFRGSEAVVDCESLATSLKGAGLRRHYQARCPFTLYDRNCGVDRAQFRVVTTLDAVSGRDLTAAAFGNKPDGWFTGGDVEFGGLPERRDVIAHNGNTITLSAPLTEAAAGDEVRAFAGCDHTPSDCKDQFSNFDRYGGIPHFSETNPFGGTAIF